jgi:hypothetical protein
MRERERERERERSVGTRLAGGLSRGLVTGEGPRGVALPPLPGRVGGARGRSRGGGGHGKFTVYTKSDSERSNTCPVDSIGKSPFN